MGDLFLNLTPTISRGASLENLQATASTHVVFVVQPHIVRFQKPQEENLS